MTVQLDGKQREIVLNLFQQIEIMQDVSFLEYNFSGEIYKTGYSELVLEDGTLNVVFTLGKNSNRVFLALTDADPEKVSLKASPLIMIFPNFTGRMD